MSVTEITPNLRELAEQSGAWPFEQARAIVARLKKKPKDEVIFATGYGPSGLPHIGTFGEVARTTMVRHAFRVLTDDTVKTRLIAFSDDMDGLRKVPVKESARATGLIVLIKLAVIVFFIAVGAGGVNTANWSPFMPFGFDGVGAAAAIVFFAYIGFDAVSTTAEEARNPQRDLPIGIFASLFICTVLYIAVAAILTGLIPYSKIDIHAPVAEALSVAGYRWGAAVVAVGAVAGITSVLVVMMIGQIRVFFAMSRDGLLGPWLSAVHPRFRTPHHATYLTGIAVAILAAFIPIGDAADMTNIGTLFAFVLVCIGVVVLRYTKPHHPRPFRMPLMPWVPLLGMLACLALMAFLPTLTWIRFVVWTIIGIAVYLMYGVRHSRLAAPSRDIPA